MGVAFESLSQLCYRRCKKFFFRFLYLLSVLQGVHTIDPSVLYVHVVDIGRELVFVVRENIYVVYITRYDRMLGFVSLKKLYSLLAYLCLFEAQSFAVYLHPVAIHAYKPVQVASEQIAYFRYIAFVLVRSLIADAGAFAFLDVILQTDAVPSLSDFLLSQIQFAGADRVDLFHKAKHPFGNECARIGAEVFGSVLFDVPCGEYTWEGFPFDHYAGVCLPIFEEDIIPRLILLDQ